MRLIILGICFILLSACSVRQQSTTNAYLDSIMKERSNLQLRYAQRTDELWQRTNEIMHENNALPMKSKDIPTLEKINQNLKYKINQVETRLSSLNNKVAQIKTGKLNAETIEITLEEGRWQPKNTPSIRLSRNQLTIVAGEKTTWQLTHANENSVKIPLKDHSGANKSEVDLKENNKVKSLPEMLITLSTHGFLYIDGQKVANIKLNKATSITVSDIALFNQQPFAVGHLTMKLKTNIIHR